MVLTCCRATDLTTILPHSGQWAQPEYLTTVERTNYAGVVRTAVDNGLVAAIQAAYEANTPGAVQPALDALVASLVSTGAVKNAGGAVNASVWIPGGTGNFSASTTGSVKTNISLALETYREFVENGNAGTTGKNLYLHNTIGKGRHAYQLLISIPLAVDPEWKPCEDPSGDGCPEDDSSSADCSSSGDCRKAFRPNVCTVRWRLG